MRNGCRNVVVQVPGGAPLGVSEFAERYCSPDAPDTPPGAARAGFGAKRGSRGERRERHAAEVEASQSALRESVAVTEKLVEDSDRMLRRHRKECDEEEGKPSR